MPDCFPLGCVQAVAKTVKETVAPMIKQYKPAQVESIEFEALTLGTLPALIDGQCTPGASVKSSQSCLVLSH